MEKRLHHNILLTLLLFISVTVMGQYTGGFPNVATFKAASASATAPGFGPELAVDSSETTWCSVTGAAPGWIMVDLGAFYNVKGFGMILPDPDELPTALTIQASEDGISWMDIRSISVAAEGTYSYDISTLIPVQYFRYNITAKDALASFAELMIYGYEWLPPSTPRTLDATGIGSDLFTANWTEKTRSEGYILTVARDVDFTDRVAGFSNRDVGDVTSYQLTGLTPATMYYYRVKAYNIAGSSIFSNVTEVTTLKIAQDISFDPVDDKIYGDADFDLTATASSGLPVSFTSSADSIATISGSTVTIVGAGMVTFTAIQNGDAMYDTAAPVAQEVMVSAKELTVSGATAENKVYDGTADAVIGGAVLEGVIGAEDVSLADADKGVFAQSDVGSAIEVTASMSLTGADSANYMLTLPTGLAADIAEKELVVTAGDYSREACEANPELKLIEYAGFVDGEDESILTESPASSCEADENSAPGDYNVTVSGGSAPNYTLAYVDGTLTVTPDVTSPTLTVQAIVVQLDAQGNGSIVPSDIVVSADDNCAVTDTTLSQDTFTLDDVGNVNVEITVLDAAGNSSTELATVTVNGPTALNEWSEIEASVFPNPTDGILELVLESPADVLKVLDMT